MNLGKTLKQYILENEFQIHIFKNRVNIVNYISIGHFDQERITINYEDGSISIIGSRLVVSRLLHDEILITGNIEKIELR